jgi:acetyl-CoA carboxylase biotin carboxyl carrier protein
MDLERIRELLQVVAESDVAEVEIEEGGLKLVVRKDAPNVTVQPAMSFMPSYPAAAYPPPPPPMAYPNPPPAPPVPPDPAQSGPNPGAETDTLKSNLSEVKAPIVGTFYRSPSPDADPFVEVGDTVSVGQVLCIIEAMKLMNEIEAEYSGTVRKILVEDAQPVEFDQPLFAIEPG